MKKHSVEEQIRLAYDLVLKSRGFRDWWPGDSPLEICLGAILTQNTNWGNVERALNNLKSRVSLGDIEALLAIPVCELEELLRPSGYFRLKTQRLRNFLTHVMQHAGGDIVKYLNGATCDIRDKLLSIKGVGPETADSILLYAGNHPIFVVDAYTQRIFTRHHWISNKHKPDYHITQNLCHASTRDYLPASRSNMTEFYQDYHAQLVGIGNQFCRPRNPDCENCPLGCLLLK